jgi:hypothetical protein
LPAADTFRRCHAAIFAIFIDIFLRHATFRFRRFAISPDYAALAPFPIDALNFCRRRWRDAAPRFFSMSLFAFDGDVRLPPFAIIFAIMTLPPPDTTLNISPLSVSLAAIFAIFRHFH